MKVVFKSWLPLSVFALMWMITGCGGSDGGSPQPSVRPPSVITGYAFAATPVSEAKVTVYSWQTGEQGDELGTTTTDENGYYEISLKVDSQPVLLVLEGGEYLEVVSQESIQIRDGYELSALVNLEAQADQKVMLTPFSTLAAALATSNAVSSSDYAPIITDANSEFSSILGIDVISTVPTDITQGPEEYAGNYPSDEMAYGFFNAAISSWTKQVSDDNNISKQSLYSTVYATRLMSRDIRSDGLLDGKELKSDLLSSIDLTLGVVRLDSQVYRKQLSQHTIAVAGSETNLTGFKEKDLIGRSNQIADSLSSVFGEMLPLPMDGEGPEITISTDYEPYFADDMQLEFTVEDLLGIDLVVISLDGENLMTIQPDSDKIKVPIDTTEYEDGAHQCVIVASDNLGNESREEIELKFSNGEPTVTLDGENYLASTPATIEGTYTEVGPEIISITLSGAAASLNANDKTWSASVSLTEGENTLEVVIKDELERETTTELTLFLDTKAPVIDTSAGHTSVEFLEDGDYVEGELANENPLNPVRITAQTNRLDGIAITEESLSAAGIAYFKFTLTDEDDALEDIEVSLSYYQDSQAVYEENELVAVDEEAGLFIIPIVEEKLSEDWDQISLDVTNTLTVSATDRAGNTTQKAFTFKASFDVPQLTINSATKASQVSVYSWNSGQKGGLIESCETDESGRCQVNLFCEAQPVLIEVTEGQYLEPASNVWVDLNDGDLLQRLAYYEMEDIEVEINPLTHLASTYSSKLAVDGVDAVDAISMGCTEISEIYDVAVCSEVPADISDEQTEYNEFDSVIRYGLVINGMSVQAQMYADEYLDDEQAIYNSITLVDAMADDLNNDGLFNGNIELGEINLSAENYRNDLADSLLAVIESDENGIGITLDDAVSYLQAIAENDHAVFNDAPVTPFDGVGPEVTPESFSEGDYFAGVITFDFSIDDKTRVESVVFDIDSNVIGSADSLSEPALTLDTAGYGYGPHILGVRSTDMLGNERYQQFLVNFDNSVVTIRTPIINGTVSIYAYSDTETELATCTTSTEGVCELNPASYAQAMLIKIKGGYYVEPATNYQVAMGGEGLSTIIHYQAQDMNVALTPISQMMTGLVEYMIEQGDSVDTAVTGSQQLLSDLYGFDVLSSEFIKINSISSITSTVTESEKYGFLLAAISSWTYQGALANGASNQAAFNSVTLGRLMSQDILADGLLDGDVKFGTQDLGPAIYRNDLADAILEMVNGSKNVTTLEIEDLLPFMLDVAHSDHEIYGDAAVVPFDSDEPEVTPVNFESDDFFKGTIQLSFSIEDKTGASEVVFEIDEVPLGVASDANNPVLSIDTDGYGYGVHTLKVTTTDLLGNHSLNEYTVHFDNSILSINSLNSGSTATVYTWNGTKGEALASCTITQNGTCDVYPMSARQPLLIEITGGTYHEMATGQNVGMGGYGLSTLINYDGQSVPVSVTPVTHVMSRYASWLVSTGQTTEAAIEQTETVFTDLYGFNPVSVSPVSVDAAESVTLNDAARYGFLLAGMSQWTEDARVINGAGNQSFYNSLLLAERMGQDVAVDGYLDGNETISFGSIALGSDAYRNGFADSMALFVNGDRNITGLTAGDLLSDMVAIAESTHAIYNGAAVTLFDDEAPVVEPSGFAQGDSFAGEMTLSFNVSDKVGIQSIEFDIDEADLGSGDPADPQVTLNTLAYANGEYEIGVRAIDLLGNETYFQISITINN